ncbi:MAG: hypothetical protein H6Q25_1641 [Bacteroidetes bacterium]|nr:hypothetical protein [Bacteroidota bacterium]
MKQSKIVLTIILGLILTYFSTELFAQDQTLSYACVTVEGKTFSKKLKVKVDFGDTPEQIKLGEEYSQILTNKKSYAAILNYMVENKFELVETLDYTENIQGSGGTAGIVFIMKKKK